MQEIGDRNKKGGRSRPLELLQRSEVVVEPELNQSCRTHGVRDRAEGCRSTDIDQVRWQERRVVEDVEEIGPEVQPLPLGNFEVFGNREVPVLLCGAAILVSLHIAESAIRTGTRRWGHGKTVLVKVATVYAALDASRGNPLA